MKCQQIGCNNHEKNISKFRKAYVTDKRRAKGKSIKRDEDGNKVYLRGNIESPVFTDDRVEYWCLECAGKYQPEKYRMIYHTVGRKTKKQRVPLPKELEKENIKNDADLIAPIVKEAPIAATVQE